MKNHVLFAIGIGLLLSVVALPAFSQVSNDNEDEVYKVDQRFARDFVPGQVLVKMKDGSPANVRRVKGKYQSAGISKLDEVLTRYGAEEMEQLLPKAKVGKTPRKAKAYNGQTIVERDLTQLYKVMLSPEKAYQTLELVDDLKALDEVEFAEPNYKVYLMADDHIADSYSGNPMVSQQWYLDAYGVKELWNKPIINPKRPVIAIIDTGVDLTHPDLKDNLWTNIAEAEGEEGYDNDGNGFKGDVHGWDFINNTPNVKDFNSHGTHVAGIAAASNNGIGIVGANPRALIMPVSVMQSDGTGDVATIIKGIEYAVQNGATVLNLSLGTYAYSLALRQSLERAYQNTIIVAAAGNDGYPVDGSSARPFFPAAFSFVLGVQAINHSGELAAFSNMDLNGNTYSSVSTLQDPDGFNYELRVPGTDILSTIPGGKYKVLQGTSMAAPLAAGAISALTMVKDYMKEENLLHQETLWGDLLHTEDIAEAYLVTNRPAELDLMKIQLQNRKDLADETEADYSGDNEIDAGEIVSIYPVIRTTFGAASNIKMHLEMGDEFEDPTTVEIMTGADNKVDFGWHLDAYGRNVSKNPLMMKIGNHVADKRHIKMKLVATCDESSQIFEKPFTVVVTNMVKINGMIKENTTLTANHNYYVNGDLGVMEGVTLTIEPGTRLEFKQGAQLAAFGKLIAKGTPQKPIVFVAHQRGGTWRDGRWKGIVSKHESTNSNLSDTLSFCHINDLFDTSGSYSDYTFVKDCVFKDFDGTLSGLISTYPGLRNNYCEISINDGFGLSVPEYSNIVNNLLSSSKYSVLPHCNYFNSCRGSYYLSCRSTTPTIEKSDKPAYLGTSKEEIIRPHILEMGNSTAEVSTYGTIDLSNMPTRPYSEAHGIVWKVVVNGKDAQDEYEDLAPLGVGKHKFEVYFNRPMNKAVAPQISFGVRDPYTQQKVDEDGSWNDDGTIYTAYKTITGKTKSDGMNRIYVYGAEDNEYFECPYEKNRFNVNVQAAGSMATGFMAEAGLGRVKLMWDNSQNDFEDAMGFNIYRYNYVEKDSLDYWGYPTGVKIIVPETVRINQDIVDIETTTYTDYDVTPGTTYYYMYKVLSTDLQEYDMSNVVAVTPQTSSLGDANGSGDVDVADVITTVNKITGMEPKPFIFEAADMNTDQVIDVLDVIGIIQKILNPAGARDVSVESTAIYTIENGTLYVESPVALAGVQVQLALSEECRAESVEFATAADLDGFEQVSAWLSDNDYLFMAYSMNGKVLTPGKHALLHIGEGRIASMRLSDASGQNVTAIGGETTTVDRMGRDVMTVEGVYDLQGRKLSTNHYPLSTIKKGVYIINGEKVVK